MQWLLKRQRGTQVASKSTWTPQGRVRYSRGSWWKIRVPAHPLRFDWRNSPLMRSPVQALLQLSKFLGLRGSRLVPTADPCCTVSHIELDGDCSTIIIIFYYLFLWTLLANKSSSVTKFILYTIFCIKYICITLKGL